MTPIHSTGTCCGGVGTDNGLRGRFIGQLLDQVYQGGAAVRQVTLDDALDPLRHRSQHGGVEGVGRNEVDLELLYFRIPASPKAA